MRRALGFGAPFVVVLERPRGRKDAFRKTNCFRGRLNGVLRIDLRALGDLELVTHASGGPCRQHISGCLEMLRGSGNASGIVDVLSTCLWVSSVLPVSRGKGPLDPWVSGVPCVRCPVVMLARGVSAG